MKNKLRVQIYSNLKSVYTLRIYQSRSGQAALNAFTIFNLAARTEGRKPPSIPIKTANKREDITIVGERLNPKESSANEPKFSVEILKN